MNPFTAWLAIAPLSHRLPVTYDDDTRYGVYVDRIGVEQPAIPAPVIIIADTPENRQKLGMEEGS